MIEHGFVEASSYTPSRVLSPTLHSVDDFVEVCYHDEKSETTDANTQEAVPSSTVPPPCSPANGSLSSAWQTVEESLITSRTNSDTLTFIPCESGSVGRTADVGDIELCGSSLYSSGDAAVTYGDESPGVHSTRLKTGISLSEAVTVSTSSKTNNDDTSSAVSDTQPSTSFVQTKTTSIGMTVCCNIYI